MRERRSADTRRHSKQATADHKATNQTSPPSAGLSASADQTHAGAPATRAAPEPSSSAALGPQTATATRSTGQRRKASTVVHLGDRTSGPVSGAVERPLSTRGPGLAPTDLATSRSAAHEPSIVVSPALSRLTENEPPLVVPATTAPASPTMPASARQTPVGPSSSRPPTDTLTGPSQRPVRPQRTGVRPGTLLLAAAAVFGVGFALTRGPSSTSVESAPASTPHDRAEREQAASTPAPTTPQPVAPKAPAPTETTAATGTTRPLAQTPPAATAPTAPPAALAATEAPTTPQPPPTPTPTAPTPQEPPADRVEVETARAAPKAPVDTKPTVAAAHKPTHSPKLAQAPAPRVANTTHAELASAKASPTLPARPLDPTDPGSRYDHVPPKSAMAPAEPIAAERRYDHVPPRAAGPATSSPEKASPAGPEKPERPSADTAIATPTQTEAERRAHERRYDHVPPKAAQIANPTEAEPKPDTARSTTPNTAPLSGSPRIYLRSDPPGATVAVLGEVRGKTPLSLDLDGQVEVVLTHPERRPATLVLEPGRGPRWLSITLDPR